MNLVLRRPASRLHPSAILGGCLSLLLSAFTALPARSQPTPAAITPETLYRFQSDTAWGRVKALVRDQKTRFQVEVESGSPATGWLLRRDAGGRTLSKGGLGPTQSFSFNVASPFQGAFALTVFLSTGGEQVPVLVAISPGKSGGSLEAAVDSPEGFKDNPDRPYNSVVKSLYEQAADGYSRGDKAHALSLLGKAMELDPGQPQVVALLAKLKGAQVGTDPLGRVRAALGKGHKEEALAMLQDYLDGHPDDPEALRLKEKIEGPSRTAPRPARPRVKKALRAKTPVPADDEDLQARADQAYNLGLDSYRQGDYAAAKRFWEQTLKILPNHLQARRNLQRLDAEHPGLK